MKYVLTGATGELGSRVFKYLVNIVPVSHIVVSLYNPAGAGKEILESGVEIRHGNYSKPETLDTAFNGGDKLLLVSYPSIAHELRVKNHIAAIDAAKRVGIKHVYYTSLMFAGDSKAGVMQAHLDTEAYLRQSGLTYTIIREGIYSESFPLYFGYFHTEQKDNQVRIPHGDGGVAWVCMEDLGEGTARLLTKDGFENKVALLTGSFPVTLSEIASKVSHILQRDPPLRLQIVSEDEYIAHNVDKDLETIKGWSTTYPALVRGELAVVDPLLEGLLGRKLKPFEETLEEELIRMGGGGASYAKKYS